MTSEEIPVNSDNMKKDIIKMVTDELISRNFIKNNKTAYENTEILLYKLNVLPQSVEFLKKELKKLEKENSKLPQVNIKSDRLILRENEKTYIYGDETLISRINELKQIIIRTNSYIKLVKDILKKFETDEYYPIIDYLYFQKKTYEDISSDFGWANGTISKHKSRLINELKIYIFPNSFIDELGT